MNSKSKYIFFILLFSLFGCLNENQLKENSKGGFKDLPCDEEMANLELISSPFSLDSLIKIEFANNIDSISQFKQLGKMYYSLNMESCKIDKTEININLLIEFEKSKKQYHLTVKRLKNEKYIVATKMLIEKNKMQLIN